MSPAGSVSPVCDRLPGPGAGPKLGRNSQEVGPIRMSIDFLLISLIVVITPGTGMIYTLDRKSVV